LSEEPMPPYSDPVRRLEALQKIISKKIEEMSSDELVAAERARIAEVMRYDKADRLAHEVRRANRGTHTVRNTLGQMVQEPNAEPEFIDSCPPELKVSLLPPPPPTVEERVAELERKLATLLPK
jgi:hypothetical protein